MAPERRRATCARPVKKDLSMSNILVINASGQETRVRLIEQGTISEYYLERKNEKGIVGNIYKGKVVRVLPGMQAAFVDIGLDKAAFLYVGDIVSDPSFPGFSEEMDIKAGSVEGDPLDADDLPEPLEEPVPQAVDTPPPGRARLARPRGDAVPQSRGHASSGRRLSRCRGGGRHRVRRRPSSRGTGRSRSRGPPPGAGARGSRGWTGGGGSS